MTDPPGSGPPPRQPGIRRSEPFSPELVEHRLGELESSSKETLNKLSDLSNQVTEIRTGMATKGQLFWAAMALLGTVIAGVLSLAGHWLMRQS